MLPTSRGNLPLIKIGQPNFCYCRWTASPPDQQEFDPTSIGGPLVFHLSQVPPLPVRLVDESGRGVAGVSLFLYKWWGRAGTLAQDLPQETDAEGRIKWLSAPKGELELQFCKLGFRCSRTNKFEADGNEHVIVLHPIAKVSGNLTDADTGAPIPVFKLTLGHAQPWIPTDETPMWDLRSSPGSNGFYRVTIEEEQRPYLRIDAEGYETLESEIPLTNEIEDVRDFQLTPQSAARSIRGTVLLPDGNPATGVEVALCTADVGVELRGTAFEPGAFGNTAVARRHDYRTKKPMRKALFYLTRKPGAHTVVAVSPCRSGASALF